MATWRGPEVAKRHASRRWVSLRATDAVGAALVVHVAGSLDLGHDGLMTLRRALWGSLCALLLVSVGGLWAHTRADPQCDTGFTCAQVDQLSWKGVDRNVGGLCVQVTLKVESTTMFRQDGWAGFRRTASQTGTVLPISTNVTIRRSCIDDTVDAGAYKEAWVDYSIATDKPSLTKARNEAARVQTDPTRATVARGRDANWLYTVARVPADTGQLDDGFDPALTLTQPRHWSAELGELRLPCVWVSVRGSVVVGDQAHPVKVNRSDEPIRLCAPGRGAAWFDKLDGYFAD